MERSAPVIPGPDETSCVIADIHTTRVCSGGYDAMFASESTDVHGNSRDAHKGVDKEAPLEQENNVEKPKEIFEKHLSDALNLTFPLSAQTTTSLREVVLAADRKKLNEVKDVFQGFEVPDAQIPSPSVRLKYKIGTVKKYFKNLQRRRQSAMKQSHSVAHALDFSAQIGEEIAAEVLKGDVLHDGIAATRAIVWPTGTGVIVHDALYTPDGIKAVSKFQRLYATEIVSSHFGCAIHLGRSVGVVMKRKADAESRFIKLLNSSATDRKEILGPVLADAGVNEKSMWRKVGMLLMRPINDGFTEILQRKLPLQEARISSTL